MNRFSFALTTLLLISIQTVHGDIVHLRSGGSVTGTVKSFKNNKQTLYVVDLGDGMKVSIAKGDVARIESDDDLLAKYRFLLAKTPDDADAQWELARWCKANTMLPQYDRHVRHVIRLNPDHKTARASLGYTEHDGEWMLYDELQRSRGLVRHDNKWKVPADVAIVEATETREVEQKLWTRKIKRLRSLALRTGKAADEALAELRGINDPVASAAIGGLLVQRKDPDQMRMLWVQLLSKWDTYEAADALIASSLFDPEPAIREACFDRLEQFAKVRAVNTYIALLRDNDNKKVRIAAHALRAMQDPRSILPLIDALETKHKVRKGGGSNVNSTFDRSGNSGGGFTFGGGKEEIVEIPFQNPPVLSALLTMAPDADFQYDEEQWRQHFSYQMSDVSFDLRRDP